MKTKVLIIQNTISPYRVPVYNIISNEFELTVMYSYGSVPDGVCFKTIKIQVKNFFIFHIHKLKIRRMASQFDVVLGMTTYSWLSNYMLAFGNRTYKYIPWGIGVPASYTVRYDDPSKKLNVFLTKLQIRYSDAVIFYTDYPVKKYSAMGLDSTRMFVAHNTVSVLPLKGNIKKDSILFIGTLYKAKSSFSMLEFYKQAYTRNNKIPILRLVGSGDEFDDIKKWIVENKLEDKVILEGAVYDEEVLRVFFESAFVCVSLGQAGLSVQKSMGYAVPFVTTDNAYTGGERLDIVDKENGFLLKEERDFVDLILDIYDNPEKYIKIGKKAKKFYDCNRTIGQMANGVVSAIRSVTSNT